MLLFSYVKNFDLIKSLRLWFSDYFVHPNFGKRLLWFIGISVIGWLLAKLIVFIWRKWVLPLAAKTEYSMDKYLGKNLHKPIARLMTLGSIYLAAQITITSTREFKSYIKTGENILYLFLILLLASLVNAILKSIADWYLNDLAPKTESSMDDTLFPVLRKVGTVIIYFIAATIILAQFKVNLTGLVATAGVVSLAVAFGAQAILADIIAGVSLILDRSFHIGDMIEIKDGLIGDVAEIGLRSTRILSVDQRLIIVPNHEVAGSRVINWSKPNSATNVKLKVGVAMDEDIGRVKQLIQDICTQEKTVSQQKPASIICTGFGPYFIELLIIATVDDCRDGYKAIDQLVMKIQEVFKREGIKLPLPLQQIQVQQLS